MGNEKKLLYASFSLSIIAHTAILVTVLLLSEGKKIEEKKIVWVSIRGASQKIARPPMEPIAKDEPAPHQNNNKTHPHTIAESRQQVKEQKIPQNNKNIQERQTSLDKKTEYKKSGKVARDNFDRKIKVRANLGRTLKKEPERPKLSKKLDSEKTGQPGISGTPRTSRAQHKSPERKIPEYTVEEIESKLASLVKEYLDEEGSENNLPELKENIKTLYAKLVQEIVQKNFEIPPAMKSKKLTTTMYVKIDREGNIADIRVVESSGDQNFDLFVMKALKDSSPFPVPPTELEFLIRFSNE